MEKDPAYAYEPYPPPLKTQTLNKRESGVKQEDTSTCRCFSATRKRPSKLRAFFAGLATNLGICVLLFGYTLVGSVVFLAIEGKEGRRGHQILAATTPMGSWNGSTVEMRERSERARARAVERIWDITVNLNILYKDNWTRLAAQEITRFQEEVLKTLAEEMGRQQVVREAAEVEGKATAGDALGEFEWTFAKAFLYSLTVLTTIGYGTIAPRTTLGKAVTMGYAVLGIPLTLLYLSSVGTILSRVARGVFSRALCCCLCSNCGYCCYDEKRMAEKERRMKRKRQQLELQQQLALQEPFYVRGSMGSPTSDEKDSLDESKTSSMHGWSILAPVMLCLVMMLVYICLGTFALYKLENWRLLDGFYFCFMSLTTIGFGDMIPGASHDPSHYNSNTTIWFCSIYIMSGMALTAMCFNVVHDEIIHRLKHHAETKRPQNVHPFDDVTEAYAS